MLLGIHHHDGLGDGQKLLNLCDASTFRLPNRAIFCRNHNLPSGRVFYPSNNNSGDNGQC